jgi:hypothetical protein
VAKIEKPMEEDAASLSFAALQIGTNDTPWYAIVTIPVPGTSAVNL